MARYILKIRRQKLQERTLEITPDTKLEFLRNIPTKVSVRMDKLDGDTLYWLTKPYAFGSTIEICGAVFRKKSPREYHEYYMEENYTRKTLPKRFKDSAKHMAVFEKALQTRQWQPLYDLVVEYNNDVKQRVYEHNKVSYDVQEEFYKKAMKLSEHGVFVQSPNAKTWVEYQAEKAYRKAFQAVIGDNSPHGLSDQQLDELYSEGKYYGVEIQEVFAAADTRETRHGFTMEPKILLHPEKSDYNKKDWNKEYFVPKPIRRDLEPRKLTNNKAIKEAYEHLQWLKQFGDEFLIPDYKRCDICKSIYHILTGCEGHVEPIASFASDKYTNFRLYGISED